MTTARERPPDPAAQEHLRRPPDKGRGHELVGGARRGRSRVATSALGLGALVAWLGACSGDSLGAIGDLCPQSLFGCDEFGLGIALDTGPSTAPIGITVTANGTSLATTCERDLEGEDWR